MIMQKRIRSDLVDEGEKKREDVLSLAVRR